MTAIQQADVEQALDLALSLSVDAATARVWTAVVLLLLLFLPNLSAIVTKGQFSLCWEGCSCIVCQTARRQGVQRERITVT